MNDTKLTWAGRAVSTLASLPFLMGAYMTLSHNPQAAEGMVRYGWPAQAGTTIMALMLGSLAVYLVPPTAVLGAVLLTGYLGGAVATHMRVGEPPVAPIVVAVLVWLGLWLREPRLRALLPLRRGFAGALLLLFFVPAHGQEWAKKSLEKSTRHGEWVTIQSAGRPLKAFVVYPEVKGKADAVVVVHEIFGLTDWARAAADEFAARGVIAIAPDLLSGQGPYPDVDAARKAVSELDPAAVMKDLDAAADYVKALPAADGKVSVAGFCWGGGQSFAFAAHRPDLKAAYVFYGPPPSDVSAIKAPVFGFYGGNDARIGATVPGTVDAMKAAGKKYEPVTYEDAGHGFMRGGEDPEGRPGDAKARAQAWKRLEKLLKR